MIFGRRFYAFSIFRFLCGIKNAPGPFGRAARQNLSEQKKKKQREPERILCESVYQKSIPFFLLKKGILF